MTSPLNFVKPHDEIMKQHFFLKDKLKNGPIMVSPSEKFELVKAYYISKSAVKSNDEVVPRLFRMNAFMAANIPLTLGLIKAPPTIAWTIFW